MSRILAFTHVSALASILIALLFPQGWILPAATALSFLHFAATLVIFYGHSSIRTEHRFVGLVLPVALVLSLGIFMFEAPDQASRTLLFFLVLVLWHYCKQSYGFFVLSFRDHPAYQRTDSLERQLILAFFLWTAFFGFLSSQMTDTHRLTFGLYVPSLGIPMHPWIELGRAGALLGLTYCGFECVRHRKPLPFLTALTFWIWCDLSLFDQKFLLLLPAFHALQYLPIALWRMLGQSKKAKALRLGAWLVGGFVLFLFFQKMPKPAPWLVVLFASAELTLNLQHYFLDAYIWRARNALIRTELEV